MKKLNKLYMIMFMDCDLNSWKGSKLGNLVLPCFARSEDEVRKYIMAYSDDIYNYFDNLRTSNGKRVLCGKYPMSVFNYHIAEQYSYSTWQDTMVLDKHGIHN